MNKVEHKIISAAPVANSDNDLSEIYDDINSATVTGLQQMPFSFIATTECPIRDSRIHVAKPLRMNAARHTRRLMPQQLQFRDAHPLLRTWPIYAKSSWAEYRAAAAVATAAVVAAAAVVVAAAAFIPATPRAGICVYGHPRRLA